MHFYNVKSIFEDACILSIYCVSVFIEFRLAIYFWISPQGTYLSTFCFGRLYDVQKLQIPVIFICLMNSVFAEGIIYIYKVYIKHLLNVLDGLQIDRRYLIY